ncbi:MAG: glycosyltransferase family 4 protein [Syntrophobacteraceae bacterium]|nr:glycosyltransferase family 4 protein [Desulfobacteraceae bacterium]
MDRSIRIHFLPMWQSHHAATSGYGQFIRYLDGNIISRDRKWKLWERAVSRAFRNVYENSGSYWYHRESFLAEFEAARRWFRGRNEIFHFLYGEQCFRFLGSIKKLSRRNFIVCTYHTPPDKFGEVVKTPRHIGDVDAAIVLSKMQIECLSRYVDREKIHYVPRGVDTRYFKPGAGKGNGRLECLFVGNFLRDFDTMSKAASLLEDNGRIRFTVVTLPRNRGHFDRNRNVEVLSGIPDSRLLELYQNSDVLVLPLLDATANNVVVEAMACGVPVVTTDLPNAGDYLDERCSRLVPPGNPQKLAETILMLERDRTLLNEMSAACRDQALGFSLEETARKTYEVYEAVLKNGQNSPAMNAVKGRASHAC